MVLRVMVLRVMINIIILIMIMISTNSDAPIGETQAAHLLIATFGGETFNFFGFPGIQPHNDYPDGSAPEIDLHHTKKRATPHLSPFCTK